MEQARPDDGMSEHNIDDAIDVADNACGSALRRSRSPS
jgi:hypothetical protein